MKVIRHVRAMSRALDGARRKNKSIGFVPTMGFLHEGHASLLRRCRKDNDISVLSIFVNPKQFGPHEDFKRYPRNFDRDELLARKEKVDIIFYPSVVEMYPQGFLTEVEVLQISNILCGHFRPKHFIGVTTVVSKLLNIVRPSVLYLGQKDAQQAVIISRMTKDLNFPLRVKTLPTIREEDGLAMSSRNTYLNREERSAAPVIFEVLSQAKAKVEHGEKNALSIIDFIRQSILKRFPARFDYIDCVDAKTLSALCVLRGKVLIAVAAWFGKTRLIDNILVRAK